MVDEPTILSVSGLTKVYGGVGGIRDLSFVVGRGETVGLLGPNGSGKSTTLHCLTGIIEQSAGTVSMGGLPHHSAAAKDQFGFLPDDLAMPESLRLPEVVTLHARLRPRFDRDFAEELVDIVGLRPHAGKYLAEYSHGMKRKLQLVTAIAHRPSLLILDEPMRGLDPEAGILIRSLLEVFTAQAGGVLVATHDLLAAEHYCDRVLVLSDGELIAEGAPRRLIDESGVESLEQFFVQVTSLQESIERTRQSVRRMRFVDPETNYTESDDGALVAEGFKEGST